MINELVSYFNPDGTPTVEGMKFFKALEASIGGGGAAWGGITGTLSSQTDLQTELDGKQDVLAEGAFADGDKTKLDGLEAYVSYPGVFSLSGSQNITTTEATLAFDTEDLDPDGNYANSSGEITVTNGGYFQVSVCVPVNDDGSTGATRGAVFMFGQRDQGSATWVNDAQTRLRAQDYHRETSGGSGVNMSGIVQLADGEAFRVRIDVSAATDVSTESGEASLSIHRIRAT